MMGLARDAGVRVRTALVTMLLLPLVGCVGRPEVVRVVDGRVVAGDFVPPESYAAFLRGAIAEERGELREALVAYVEASAHDEGDPEIWTRIGEVRCAMNPRDRGAQVALERALAIDAEYAGAWTANARCAMARGESATAGQSALRAARADPMAVEPQAILAQADAAAPHVVEARVRLVALTLAVGWRTAAWDALAAWARAHGDAMLAARALKEVARLAPSRRAELGERVLEMAGDGELSAARALAGGVVDGEGSDRSSGGLGPAASASPLVARLAIDDALLAHDADRARVRATRTHVGLEVAAGRALALGEPSLARELAEPLAVADPRAVGARMVLAVVGDALGDASLVSRAFAAAGLAGPEGGAAPEVLLPFARLVARTSSPEVARRVLEATPHDRALSGDALFTPLAVELAAAGVLNGEDLPLDARIELAARRLEAPPAFDGELVSQAPHAAGRQACCAAWSTTDRDSVDARHRLLALSLRRPLDPGALDLARHLAPSAAKDPLIAVALARLSLARGAPIDASAMDKLVALSPADPLVAAAALDLAKRGGDARAIVPARARLTALARTPGERAHALE